MRKVVNLIQQYDPIAFWAAHKIFRDIAYYFNPNMLISDRKHNKRPLRNILMRELIDEIGHHQDKEIIIIGHFMGSIICYDVLRSIRSFFPNITIKSLFTLGSPLRYTLVKTHPFLSLTDGHFRYKRRTPTAVKSWYNFSDPKDIACYHLKLLHYYKTNKDGVKVHDILVNNQYQTYNYNLKKIINPPPPQILWLSSLSRSLQNIA